MTLFKSTPASFFARSPAHSHPLRVLQLAPLDRTTLSRTFSISAQTDEILNPKPIRLVSDKPTRFLVFGLGNTGKKYERTRHNVGRECVEYLCQQYRVELAQPRRAATYRTAALILRVPFVPPLAQLAVASMQKRDVKREQQQRVVAHRNEHPEISFKEAAAIVQQQMEQEAAQPQPQSDASGATIESAQLPQSEEPIEVGSAAQESDPAASFPDAADASITPTKPGPVDSSAPRDVPTHEDIELHLNTNENFMNRSGSSLASAMTIQSVASHRRIVIIYDDVSLPLGTIRLRDSGSTAGQKGMESICRRLGGEGRCRTLRIRIGIGPQHGEMQVKEMSRYVLGRFTDPDYEIVRQTMERVKHCLELCLSSNRDIRQIQAIVNRSAEEWRTDQLLLDYKIKQAMADAARTKAAQLKKQQPE